MREKLSWRLLIVGTDKKQGSHGLNDYRYRYVEIV